MRIFAQSRRRILTFLATVLVGGSLVGVVALPASASGTRPQSSGFPAQRQGAAPPAKQAVLRDRPVPIRSAAPNATSIGVPGPSGCWGQSNNPHRSTHGPAPINAEARTGCYWGSVPEMYTDVALYRNVWAFVWWQVDNESA